MAEIKPLILNSGDFAEMSPTADSIRMSSLGVGVASPGAGSLSMTGTLTVSSMGAGALVTNASGVASSIPGVAGQLLTSNGPGVAPSFQAPPPASVDIGSSIPSGTAGRVLFVGAGPALAEDAAFTWDSVAKFLTVGGGAATYDVGAVRSLDGDVSVGAYNTDNVGTTARSVVRTLNPSFEFTEVGTTANGFVTSGPLSANNSFLRSSCVAGLKIISSNSITFFPTGSATSALTMTSTAITAADGVPVIAGTGGTTFDIGVVRSLNGDVYAGAYNTDNVGATARSVVRALNPSGEFIEIGATGNGFVTAGSIDANDTFLRSNCANGLKILSVALGFFGANPVTQQAVTDLTNGIAVGGTADTLTNYSDLTVYANDALLIRDNFYQLGQKVVQILAALKNYGILV